MSQDEPPQEEEEGEEGGDEGKRSLFPTNNSENMKLEMSEAAELVTV